LLEALAKVDLIALNCVESEALLPVLAARSNGGPTRTTDEPEGPDAPVPRLMKLGLSFGGFDMGLRSYLDGMLRLGRVKRVVVTDGTEGAYLADDEGIHYCPAARTEVMGTAGAGDAFVATLAKFLAERAPPDVAMRAAAINAASVVAEIDTQGGLLSAADLGERIATQAGTLPVTHWRWTS
jgi:ribokinase